MFNHSDIPDDVWLEIFASFHPPRLLFPLLSASYPISLPAPIKYSNNSGRTSVQTRDDVQPGITTLLAVSATCRRFNYLSKNLLLRDLRWVTHKGAWKSLEAWDVGEVVHPHISIPKRVCIGVNFEVLDMNYRTTVELSKVDQLHDALYRQISLFPTLHSVILDGTLLSPYAYSVLSNIQTLRSLVIKDCFYAGHIHCPFSAPRVSPERPPTPVYTFPRLTHFSLHNPRTPTDPLHILTALQNVTSLSLTWTPTVAYAFKKISDWMLGPQLCVIELRISKLIVEDVHDFVCFVREACGAGGEGIFLGAVNGYGYSFASGSPAIARDPPRNPKLRVHLEIEKHLLSAIQLRDTELRIGRVCSYKGPIELASFGISRDVFKKERKDGKTSISPLKVFTQTFCKLPDSPLRFPGDEESTAGHSLPCAATIGLLTHSFPVTLEELDVKIMNWDMEILYAIRFLFPSMRKVFIRFGEGEFRDDFYPSLGSTILPYLPNLHTLQIVQDSSCTTPPSSQGQAQACRVRVGGYDRDEEERVRSRYWERVEAHGQRGGLCEDCVIKTRQAGHFSWALESLKSTVPPMADAADSIEVPSIWPEQLALYDYLLGWMRNNTSLQAIQLDDFPLSPRFFRGQRGYSESNPDGIEEEDENELQIQDRRECKLCWVSYRDLEWATAVRGEKEWVRRRAKRREEETKRIMWVRKRALTSGGKDEWHFKKVDREVDEE